MRVTGYQLREAIKAQSARRDFAAAQFADTLKVFPGETKPNPLEVMNQLTAAEYAVAMLQVAQMRYNLQVKIGAATLAEAVKRIGGIARVEKMWRVVAAPKKDRYSLSERGERNADTIVAHDAVSRDAAHAQAQVMARHASTLRQEIAVANATVIEMDLDASLLI